MDIQYTPCPLDEAHKLLTGTSEASTPTSDLVSIVRQQCRLDDRVVIATQEPTLAGDLLDLRNVSIVHRFSSPRWYNTIEVHVAGARAQSNRSHDLFQNIVNLQTGAAHIFRPTAIAPDEAHVVCLLSRGSIRVQVQPRISLDGGKSLRATDVYCMEQNETQNLVPAFTPWNYKDPPWLDGLGEQAMMHARAPGQSPRALVKPKKASASSSMSHDGQTQVRDSFGSPVRIIYGNTIAVRRSASPDCSTREFSRVIFDECLRTTLLQIIRTTPKLYTQDTHTKLRIVQENANLRCKLPPKYLGKHKVLWNGGPRWTMYILQCLLK